MKSLSRGLAALCMLWISGLGCSPHSASVTTVSAPVAGAEQWLEQGRRLAQQGSMARAEEYLLAAWAEGASSHDVLPLLLSMCLSEGRLRTALEYARRARRDEPREPRLLQLSISLHMALGHKSLARREVETLAQLEPRYQQAVYFLGEQFFLLGQVERARSYLEQYKASWPHAPDVPWVNHMLTLMAQEQHDAEQLSAHASMPTLIPSDEALPEGDGR